MSDAVVRANNDNVNDTVCTLVRLAAAGSALHAQFVTLHEGNLRIARTAMSNHEQTSTTFTTALRNAVLSDLRRKYDTAMAAFCDALVAGNETAARHWMGEAEMHSVGVAALDPGLAPDLAVVRSYYATFTYCRNFIAANEATPDTPAYMYAWGDLHVTRASRHC